MAFDPSVILDGPHVIRVGPELIVSWTSSLPPNTATYQVYIDGRLNWSGRAWRTILPATDRMVYVQVGAVGAGEDRADFSGSLADRPGNGSRAGLTWYGGTYLDEDIVGFRVFGEPSPGAGVDFDAVLADVVAYPGGFLEDGAGVGGAGLGGAGRSASSYSWTSGPLTAGTWTFVVKTYDAAGNLGTGRTISCVIQAPPLAPAPFADGARLHGDYDPATRLLTLTWNPPPIGI